MPLVLDVHSADIMATLLILKAEVEDKLGSRMKMVFSGGAEAHMLAKEIGAPNIESVSINSLLFIAHAGVGVILSPSKPMPAAWDSRRT